MRKTVLDTVYELAREDKRIVFIGSDLGHGVLDDFKKEIPDRFFMEGISEQHVVGMAAGMAMEGKIPYVNTIATFLTRRCFEQVAVDLCLHNLPVRLIANGGGLVYAPLGPTHLAIEDIAILRPLPNLTIISPADANEMKRLVPQTVDLPGPVYIRLAKGYDPIVTREDLPCTLGSGVKMKEGSDVLFITTGITLGQALEAAETLESEGRSVAVLHLHTLKPVDTQAVIEMSEAVKAVVTIEEHVLQGGLGSLVGEILLDHDVRPERGVRRLGIPDQFPDKYGSQNEHLDYFGINAKALCQVSRELLG